MTSNDTTMSKRRSLITRMCSVAILSVVSTANLNAFQFSPVPVASTAEVPESALIQAAELNQLLANPGRETPLVLQVGSQMMFAQGHIPGSEFAGPAVQPEGLELLRRRTEKLPRTKQIVIYCGCCPWNRCPNIGTAYRYLRQLGFKNVKALYMANNFGADWVAKGYRVER